MSNLLSQFCDVGAFNEMYVEDTETDVLLVVRPAPFESVRGNAIQANATAAKYTVKIADFMSINSSRSDAGVANYYWVGNTAFNLMNDGTARMMAQTGNKDDYVLFDYPNSAANIYGIRKMEIESHLGGPEVSSGDAEPKSNGLEQQGKMLTWIDKRRKILAESNKDNVVFEQGSIRMFGDENIKAGMSLICSAAAADDSWGCYVTAVEHEFIPYQGMFTTVQFERGTEFIRRAQRAQGSTYYLSETEIGGIVGA